MGQSPIRRRPGGAFLWDLAHSEDPLWEGACPRWQWVSGACISWHTAIGGKPLPHLDCISRRVQRVVWQTCITNKPINIDLRSRIFLNVTVERKCVTLRPGMRQTATSAPRKTAFQTPPQIRLNATLAVPEGFANNRPAICSISWFNIFCLCIKFRGCQWAGTAFSVLL